MNKSESLIRIAENANPLMTTNKTTPTYVVGDQISRGSEIYNVSSIMTEDDGSNMYVLTSTDGEVVVPVSEVDNDPEVSKVE